MASGLIDQICYSGVSDCNQFKPHFLRPNFCTSCMKLIEKHKREAIKLAEDVVKALEHSQKGEKEGTAIMEPTNGLGAVYLGGFKSAINDDFLRKNDIKHVLNVAGLRLAKIFGPKYETIAMEIHKELDLNVLNLEWEDSLEFELTFDALSMAAQFIEDARKSGSVLVHCAQGKSRSASAVCAYLMAKEGLSMLDSIEKIQEHRKMADPNANFRETLKKYESSESLKTLRESIA